MKSLRSLPQSAGSWEVLEADPPGPIVGARSILLVVEADTERVRLATPMAAGDAVAAYIRGAFTEPIAGTTPGRPRALVVRDPALLQALAPLLAEAGVLGVLAEALPVAEGILASLVASLGAAVGPPAPGITVDLAGWRQSLEAFVRLAPWERLADDVEFTFTGGGLDGALAVVLGNAGQVRGFVLYASRAEHARFLDTAAAEDLSAARSWTVYLEPPEHLDDAERQACAAAGLALPGGDCPRLFELRDGEALALDPDGQRRMRLALDAVTALCAAKLEVLAEGGAASTSFRRGAVTVEVRGEPADEPLHLLVQADCAYSTGALGLTKDGVRTEYPALLLKLRKKEGLALAATLAPVTRLTLRRGEIVAHGAFLGVLGCLVPAGVECDSLVEGWKHGGDVLIVVCAGGSTRATFRSEDVLRSQVVRFERE